jgi:hypothetical protein
MRRADFFIISAWLLAFAGILFSQPGTLIGPSNIRPCSNGAMQMTMAQSTPGSPAVNTCVVLDTAAFAITPATPTSPATLTTIRPSVPFPIPTFVYSETPSGAIDGNNRFFTLAANPIAGTVRVYRNGLRLTPGQDYTITSGGPISFVQGLAPQTGDLLLVDYNK